MGGGDKGWWEAGRDALAFPYGHRRPLAPSHIWTSVAHPRDKRWRLLQLWSASEPGEGRGRGEGRRRQQRKTQQRASWTISCHVFT